MRSVQYSVTYSDRALKALQKMDNSIATMIYAWIDKNLENCDDPRQHGRALTGNKKGYWRYRVGAYRLIAVIHDKVVTIEIVNISHRQDVYI